MTNAERRDSVRAWMVPALLALIGVLVLLGGGQLTGAMQDQVCETRALRGDLSGLKATMEGFDRRITNLESCQSKK
jgi:hypothetical protein